jgi:mannose-6-phosphate isomerase-like protein (cupin superfamily)
MIRPASEMKAEVRPNMRGGLGTVTVTPYFQKEEFGGKVRLCARLTLPPGASIGLHAHEGEDEVYIVTRGAGLVKEGDVETRVTTGDAVLTGRGASHSVRNDSPSDVLEIVAVIVCY